MSKSQNNVIIYLVIKMRWSKEEIDYLREEYSKLSGENVTNVLDRISKKLNRTKGSIRNKAYELGITHREKYYTKDEIQYLKDNYDKVSMNDMATFLKRNESNIFRKMKQLGLHKTKRQKNTINPKKNHKFTEQEKLNLSKIKKEYYLTHMHPKGFKGHKHSQETKTKMSISTKESWKDMTNEKVNQRTIKQRNTKIRNGTLNPMINQEKPYSRAKGGKRKDLNNIYFRSSWEANIARYYNFIGVKWEFEPKTFIFNNVKRGSISYTPDFYLPKEDKWVEVKGWMDGKSKTKLKRFKEQYPEEYNKLELITQKEYNEIKKKMSSFIKGWE